jgi:hypothetical protein
VTGRAPIGKRTAQLLRDAIVLAHVEGVWWGRAVPRGSQEDQYPKDSEVIAKVLEAARRNKDHYGALGRLADRLDAHARARQEDS